MFQGSRSTTHPNYHYMGSHNSQPKNNREMSVEQYCAVAPDALCQKHECDIAHNVLSLKDQSTTAVSPCEIHQDDERRYSLPFLFQWRPDEKDGVSNSRSNKTSKLCVTGLREGNPPVIGEFPTQRASNAENVSISRRHHVDESFISGMKVVILTAYFQCSHWRKFHQHDDICVSVRMNGLYYPCER